MDARIRAVPCGRLRAIRIAAVVAPLVLWIVIANMFTGPPRVHNAASAEARYEWCANDALQNKPIQNFDQYLGACIREWQNSRHANLTAVDLAHGGRAARNRLERGYVGQNGPDLRLQERGSYRLASHEERSG